MYTHTYIYTYIHTYIHTYIYYVPYEATVSIITPPYPPHHLRWPTVRYPARCISLEDPTPWPRSGVFSKSLGADVHLQPTKTPRF